MICAVDWSKDKTDKTVFLFFERTDETIKVVKEIALSFDETIALKKAVGML